MTTEAQIYAIGTCAVGIPPNRLSSLTCQPITSLLCKTNPILSAVGGLQMNVSSLITVDYENKWQRRVRKNKPNSNPISEKPKCSKKGLYSIRSGSGGKKQKPLFYTGSGKWAVLDLNQ